MADNYLEKRMDDYRNSGSGVVVRKHKMPKKKRVLVFGCRYKAHIDLVRSLCNGGHQIDICEVDADLVGDVRRTLAKVVDVPGGEYDVVVICDGDLKSFDFADRVVVVCYAKEDGRQVDWDGEEGKNVNTILFADKEDGVKMSKMVRLLVDSDEDLMNRQVIEML
ncbi:MAG: hypothetical protein MJZ27_10720 [Bacteroidales bacterium]|nr:hypothetical protein [Bacteroidales bacterium]